MIICRTFCLVLVALFLGSSVRASIAGSGEGSGEPAPPRISVSALLSQTSVVPGGEVYLAVVYEIAPDAHIQVNEFFYAKPSEGEPYALGAPALPRAVTYEGESVYQGTTTVFYAARLSPELALGPQTLRLDAGYQACTEQPIFACYPPEDLSLSVPVEVVSDHGKIQPANQTLFAAMPVRPEPPAGTAVSTAPGEEPGWIPEAVTSSSPETGAPPPEARVSLEGKLEQALARGSLLAFFMVFLGGIATSFTPCVYPMIPITISYIGGRSRTKLSGFILSLFFVLGIALMYSTLGVLAASTGALFGSAMQSTPVLLGVSLVFFAMGASMLGAFDLALPSGLQTKLQSGPRTGILGAIFMGIVTGLVASPCVGPVLVVLLAWVAKVGAIGYGFLLLFVFALGLGMLFLVIGTFAGALNALPKAGQWMDSVKSVFGVILIGMGIYYLRSLLGPGMTWLLSGIFVLLVATFLGAFRPVGEEAPKSVLLRKGFGIALLVTGVFALWMGLSQVAGTPLGAGVGRTPTEVEEAPHAGLTWLPDDRTGMAQARQEGKPVVMDFYADWCAACKELDEKTWVHPAVRKEAERFVAIKLDFTERNDWSAAKQAEYRVLGLPTVILLDSMGNEIERFFGFRSADLVLASMQKIR